MADRYDLRVTVLIKDDIKNTFQEFNSHVDFTVERICDWKQRNASLQLDMDKYKLLPRKYYPLKNFIEQTLMQDYRKWLKDFQKENQD